MGRNLNTPFSFTIVLIAAFATSGSVHAGQIFQWDSGRPILSDEYELYGYNSAKCVTLHGDNLENDAIIDIWGCQHKINQKWTFGSFDWANSANTGRYALVNRLSGKCLTAGPRGGSTDEDEFQQIHVYQYACSSEYNPYQLWEMNQSWDYRTYWFIENVGTKKCLSVSKGQTNEGAAMTVWACDTTTPSTNQLYYFW
ncbi:uncharacterized protein LOC110850244 [Folsomia candida]|uniref:uncharacterized protein LOC110850244 n=1 Tax=Folsomia candida TaxID=158441 RepID=UPI000B8F2BB8|nr:uncharacterized protein LOC110850244 [Folsomia candida]